MEEPFCMDGLDVPIESKNAHMCRIREFEKAYRKPEHDVTMKEILLKGCRRACSRKSLQRTVLSNFPFISMIRHYKPSDIPRDLLAGVTVAIMHIPQSMAYAQLATLPPVCGLYMAFFSSLCYFFLGTSRHASPGCIAIVSLMIASVVDRSIENTVFPQVMVANATNTSDTASVDANHVDHRIAVAGAVSIISGLIMIFFGKIGLGIVTTYMSESLVAGFTTGAAIHIFTSQLKNLLGLKSTKHHGPLNIVKTWISYFKNITTINAASTITGCICIVVLYIVKVHINQRFKKRLTIPIPIELIVLIVTTIISHYAHFKIDFGARVVGVVPTGMVTPNVPDISLAKDFVADAVAIGIVAFAQSISMCKIVARKNNYKVDSNQEMVAYGASSVVCSFFSGYVPAISITRTLVQEATGGVTEVAALFTCAILLVVTITAGPLFYSLPNCVLSAIVITNLRGMFRQFLELNSLWKNCKHDFAIWVVTCAAVVVINADLGLAIGILFSLITVVVRTQRASTNSIGQVNGTEVYGSTKYYDDVHCHPAVCIVSYGSPIYFANSEIFIQKVYKTTGIDPSSTIKFTSTNIKSTVTVSNNSNHRKLTSSSNGESFETTELQTLKCSPETADDGMITSAEEYRTEGKTLKYIILDFSCVNFMDLMGLKALKEVIREYENIDIIVYIVGCRGDVLQIMEKTNFIKDFEKMLFISIKCAMENIKALLGNKEAFVFNNLLRYPIVFAYWATDTILTVQGMNMWKSFEVITDLDK